MIRAVALIVAVLVVSSIDAIGQDIRPATEEEITIGLQGCWNRESTLEETAYEERKRHPLELSYQVMACFDADGVVHTSWVGGFEGIEDAGTYLAANGKLQLRGPGPSDGWTFAANDLDCDVVMSPGRAMRLMNCVGVGADAGEVIADSSFELVRGPND